MKYVVVIPYNYRPYFEACLQTLKIPTENILAIDNTSNNRGVAGSWNLGIKKMEEVDANWLIIMSAAMRFGERGGIDMIEQLEAHPNAHIVNFADNSNEESQFKRGVSVGIEAGMFSWHCCAVSRSVINKVGKFDANFYPIYFEDIDYDLRVSKAYGKHIDWPIVPIDAFSAGSGHGIRLGKAKSPSTPLIAYFAEKWGKHPSASKINSFDKPFDDIHKSLAFWPPAHGELWDE